MLVLYLSIWRGEVVIKTALQFAPSPWTDFLCALSDSMTPNLASLVYHVFLFMVWIFSISPSLSVCVCCKEPLSILLVFVYVCKYIGL